MERELELPEGSLVFSKKAEGYELTRCIGNFAELIVPEDPWGDGKVTGVSKKVFLGKRTIRKLLLPQTVMRIGDYCFAGCSSLSAVSLPVCEIGEGIFRGCVSLETVSFPGRSEDLGRLLACAIRNECPSHLTDVRSIDEGWFKLFDSWVGKLLAEADDEGFQNQILCGEEDYGSCDKDAYEQRARVRKAFLCISRLINDEGLADPFREKFSDYLRRHKMGSEEGSETWIALKEHFPDRKHFDLLKSLGCIDDDNRDKMIRDLGDDRQELKSLLIKSSGNDAGVRFFSSLEL